MFTIEFMKQRLLNSNTKVHEDMTGPTDLIDNIPVTARTYDATVIDMVLDHIRQYKNVSFYKIDKNRIRYSVWN